VAAYQASFEPRLVDSTAHTIMPQGGGQLNGGPSSAEVGTLEDELAEMRRKAEEAAEAARRAEQRVATLSSDIDEKSGNAAPRSANKGRNSGGGGVSKCAATEFHVRPFNKISGSIWTKEDFWSLTHSAELAACVAKRVLRQTGDSESVVDVEGMKSIYTQVGESRSVVQCRGALIPRWSASCFLPPRNAGNIKYQYPLSRSARSLFIINI